MRELNLEISHRKLELSLFDYKRLDELLIIRLLSNVMYFRVCIWC